MKKPLCFLLVFFSFAGIKAQQQDSLLQEVTVHAYLADKPLNEVAASLGYLSGTDLQRYNNTSFLPAVNTIPGVRMEERSPGSYRFAIRGSSIRSPFGIRNVKMYWNGLPLTDGGGNTYLNLIDFDAVGSVEIIKGPGGSLYGAGTGGVILLNTPVISENRINLSEIGGSFGLLRYRVAGEWRNKHVNGRVSVANQQSDGYRWGTALKRTTLNTDLNIRLGEKSTITPTLLYTDLYYQTPGALTETQYQEDPKQARPGTPAAPGAVTQRAAVYNKTFYGGIVHDQQWNDRWSTQTGFFTSFIDFKNPAIRNYEKRSEKNVGARTQTKYRFNKSNDNNTLSFGAEFQHFNSEIDVLQNNAGIAGDLITSDRLTSSMFLIFAQEDVEVLHDLFLTLGGSVNFLNVDFMRLQPLHDIGSKRFTPVFLPRIALLKKVKTISIHGSVSQGFSPPTIAELYPSRQIFDTHLNAEQGYNMELGAKGSFLNEKIGIDITVYNFLLKRTIVVRHDTTLAGDPEYFINAGKTKQHGIEATLRWTAISNNSAICQGLKLWVTYTYNDYRFVNYTQDVNDLSGKKLTGVPPTIFNAGLDVNLFRTFYLNVTTNYVDHIPLNDANTDYSNEYFLLGARAGYKTPVNNHQGAEIFVGIDNALDKRYSLGNDLNAAAGRYFNAAAPRNYYVGVKFDLSLKK
jgi:iron complex outermembrane receptor protein